MERWKNNDAMTSAALPLKWHHASPRAGGILASLESADFDVGVISGLAISNFLRRFSNFGSSTAVWAPGAVSPTTHHRLDRLPLITVDYRADGDGEHPRAAPPHTCIRTDMEGSRCEDVA